MPDLLSKFLSLGCFAIVKGLRKRSNPDIVKGTPPGAQDVIDENGLWSSWAFGAQEREAFSCHGQFSYGTTKHRAVIRSGLFDYMSCSHKEPIIDCDPDRKVVKTCYCRSLTCNAGYSLTWSGDVFKVPTCEATIMKGTPPGAPALTDGNGLWSSWGFRADEGQVFSCHGQLSYGISKHMAVIRSGRFDYIKCTHKDPRIDADPANKYTKYCYCRTLTCQDGYSFTWDGDVFSLPTCRP